MSLPVILYRYEGSPYAHKVDNALTLKRIPHQIVSVSPVLPRPEVADILGIPYRRIPILAIGNDIYCDTSLIVSTLERRFPASQGFGTLFPARNNGGTPDTGLIKAFSKFYIDRSLFSVAALLLPWEKLPPAFLKDRSERCPNECKGYCCLKRQGSCPTFLPYGKSHPVFISWKNEVTSRQVLVEEQLKDGRTWLFDTQAPSLADISIHFVLAWALGFPAAKPLRQDGRFPLTHKWLSALTAYLKDHHQKPTVINGAEAGNLVFSSPHEGYSIVGFDTTEAQRLGVKLNDVVSVTPDDTGRSYPTTGKLVALSTEEVVLEIVAKKGTVRCHFPRLGYVIGIPKTVAKL
ncbi:hypothetical protein CC1G_00273 [Coprinopsis cinerea okayama7|uniref:Uncharacterized protein n=1 Tax=Coprinopsis cinerea (strain Okayama-7 / 130 / ATCC MYA-4618 / FGSC 9003) TaxID=240176 RepID=A8NXD5_COPC7|nr:hypothetical protein CC1G_00273 [Coprinopsis cinerea okayama7\|eukprot:XP_001837137.2 hypothetical protein CC1G_00273 [Coprinopsis cinerea okayama7\